MRLRSVFLGLVVTALALTACAPTSAAPTPSTEPTPILPVEPTPIVTTAPAAPRADAILLSAVGFTIVDGDGEVLFAHEWPDEAAPALVALEDAFGTAPAESIREGDGFHSGDFAVYTWEGFTFADILDLAKPREDYPRSSFVEITEATAGGLHLRTPSGISVGMTRDDALALGAVPFPYPGTEDLMSDPLEPEKLTDPNAGTPIVYLRVEGSTVAEMSAPLRSAGNL